MYRQRLPYWFLLLAVTCGETTAGSSGVVDNEKSQQSEYDEPLQPSFIPELDFSKNLPKRVRGGAEAQYGVEECKTECSRMYSTLSCISSLYLDGTSVQSLESNVLQGCPTADNCYCCTKCGAGGRNSGCMQNVQTVEFAPNSCYFTQEEEVSPTEIVEDCPTTTFDKIHDKTKIIPLQSQIVQLDWPVII